MSCSSSDDETMDKTSASVFDNTIIEETTTRVDCMTSTTPITSHASTVSSIQDRYNTKLGHLIVTKC